jgi:hypothetical protein
MALSEFRLAQAKNQNPISKITKVESVGDVVQAV